METIKVSEQYHLIIRYFLLMFLMLLITGIWLLLLNSSFSFESFTNYYVQKSVFGLLEIVTPHLFAMGIVIFILTHFLALNTKHTNFNNKITLTLFTFMLLSNLSSFFITQSTIYMIWLKIISILLLLLFSSVIIFKVCKRTRKI